MKILCTFPGKYGDLLWALPTIRAISRRAGEPVDLWVAKPFASITPLLSHQPYLGLVAAIDTWEVRDTAPMTPRAPAILDALPTRYDRILNLGYRDWPLPDVARHTWETACQELAPDAMLEALDLTTPWIVPAPGSPTGRTAWLAAFTDEYFELKVGVWDLLTDPINFRHPDVRPRYSWEGRNSIGGGPLSISTGARWTREAGHSGCEWVQGAAWMTRTGAVLADCSAWHVLAVAMGVPVVMMEPQPMRHNAIFYPVGAAGPQVYLVKGIDNQPTWDARHIGDALEQVLARRRS